MSKWKGFDKNVSDASKTDKNLIVGRELQKQRKVWKGLNLMMLWILIQDKR